MNTAESVFDKSFLSVVVVLLLGCGFIVENDEEDEEENDCTARNFQTRSDYGNSSGHQVLFRLRAGQSRGFETPF